jgi:predicted Fe-Mo cluster-binding NifX family protein
MHVDHKGVEYVAAEEQDYEEVIEEYEEIFMLEEF